MSSRKDKRGSHKRGSKDKDSKKSTSEKKRKLEDELSQYLEELDQLRNERDWLINARSALQQDGVETYNLRAHTQSMPRDQMQLLANSSSSARARRGLKGSLGKREQTEDIYSSKATTQRHKKEADRMQTHSNFLTHTSKYQAEEYIEYGEDLRKVDKKIARSLSPRAGALGYWGRGSVLGRGSGPPIFFLTGGNVYCIRILPAESIFK